MIYPRRIFLGSFLFVGYVLTTLAVGEVHPFSRFPMYNSFPNWAYSFCLKDSAGQMLPFISYTNTRSGSVAHQYYTVSALNNFAYGDGKEAPEQLQLVGREMMERIDFVKKPEVGDTVSLYLVFYYLEDGEIKKRESLIGQKHVVGDL